MYRTRITAFEICKSIILTILMLDQKQLQKDKENRLRAQILIIVLLHLNLKFSNACTPLANVKSMTTILKYAA